MGLIANIGLPMISVFLPPAWLALIPVIAIETAVGVRTTHAPPRWVMLATAVANCFSTILGVPLAWAALAIVQCKLIGTASASYAAVINFAWLPPYERELHWMVPIATVVLSLPMWLMSVVSEQIIAKRFLPEVESRTVWRWMLKGNAASYLFLVVLALVLPLLGAGAGEIYRATEPATEAIVEQVLRIMSAR